MTTMSIMVANYFNNFRDGSLGGEEEAGVAPDAPSAVAAAAECREGVEGSDLLVVWLAYFFVSLSRAVRTMSLVRSSGRTSGEVFTAAG
jgi:hypothetical protein